MDDALNAFEVVLRNLCLCLTQLAANTWDHLEELIERPHVPQLLKLIEEVLEVELALEHPVLMALGFLFVSMLLGAFDQRNDVAHPENAAGEPLRVERLKCVDLFSGADKFDRNAGDCADRKRCAATGVAVHLCQDKS